MSSPVKSLSEYETSYLIKIRKQFDDTLNFQDKSVSNRVIRFKQQEHTNCFEELLEAWEEYRDDNGAEEDEDNDDINDIPQLPELTKLRTTDEPETVESLILDRHLYEMLYNILLASHYNMKQRKGKLLKELYEQITIKQNKKKKVEIISKYLPKNDKTMKTIINHIYDSIVQKHYSRCNVFTELKKQRIITYIKGCCILSFEMLISQNELSFFPLLFTDQSTSYISPVVRYDRIIKEKEKKNKSGSLDENSFMQIIKKKKAENGFIEGRHHRSYSSIGRATQILYYTFPGVISLSQNKELQDADVFTHDDPSIFLRHDLNWIFSDKYFRTKKINKYKKNTSVGIEEDTEDDDNIFVAASNESDPYHKIESIVPKMEMVMDKLMDNNDIIKNRNFLGKPQLIQCWTSLKKQKVNQLCEELCELIMEQMEDESDDDDDDDDSKADDDDDDDDDEEDPEYEGNKISMEVLFKLMIKSRDAMKLKMTTNNIANNKDNLSYLNMCSLYKYFTNSTTNDMKNKVDMKHGYVVKSIVNSIFDAVIDEEYEEYEFLKNNKKLSQLLREFIAECCQLICNILHHEWDLCPLSLDGNKCLNKFDERIHIKDNNLSMEDSNNNIDYCSFPGIIAKSCWNQFDSQYNKNKIDEKQIETIIIYKMSTCLNINDEQ